MQKILSLSALIALVQCGTVVPSEVLIAKTTPFKGSWPVLDLYTTFKADGSVFTETNGKITPYKGITATLKVDGDRNKIKVDAKVAVPLIGKINAEVLADLTAGMVYEYVPFLGICQKTNLGQSVPLKELLQKIYSPDGGVTQFDGEATAPWDPSTMYKFHGSGPDVTVTAYFDENTHNGKWIEAIPTNTTMPSVVVSLPLGEQPATFTDDDFTIKGCASYTEENLVNIWQ